MRIDFFDCKAIYIFTVTACEVYPYISVGFKRIL